MGESLTLSVRFIGLNFGIATGAPPDFKALVKIPDEDGFEDDDDNDDDNADDDDDDDDNADDEDDDDDNADDEDPAVTVVAAAPDGDNENVATGYINSSNLFISALHRSTQAGLTLTQSRIPAAFRIFSSPLAQIMCV